MPEHFKIRVAKDYTGFSSAHFITYEGGKCEKLHGHNYYAAVSLEGKLNDKAYIFDFVVLKKCLSSICERLDHRMLLPTNNPSLVVVEETSSITVRHGEKTYVFPREDVVVLPIPNTTAEMLASWIGQSLEAALSAYGLTDLTELEIEVEETVGQRAFWRKSDDISDSHP